MANDLEPDMSPKPMRRLPKTKKTLQSESMEWPGDAAVCQLFRDALLNSSSDAWAMLVKLYLNAEGGRELDERNGLPRDFKQLDVWSNNDIVFGLFRKAILDSDDDAWTMLTQRYIYPPSGRVYWQVYRHFSVNYWRLIEPYHLKAAVDLAWSQFYLFYNRSKMDGADSLIGVHTFLEKCTYSMAEQYLIDEFIRRSGEDPMPDSEMEDQPDDVINRKLALLAQTSESLTDGAAREELLRRFWACLRKNCTHTADGKLRPKVDAERDWLIIRLHYYFGYPPRDIPKASEGVIKTKQEVFECEHNFWDRLPNQPCYKKFLQDYGHSDN